MATGPAWRLMGIIFGTVFFLTFTPTKWIHHFGLFAAVGAAMAALATVLMGPTVLLSLRNRMSFLAVVLFVLALCLALPLNAAQRGKGEKPGGEKSRSESEGKKPGGGILLQPTVLGQLFDQMLLVQRFYSTAWGRQLAFSPRRGDYGLVPQ